MTKKSLLATVLLVCVSVLFAAIVISGLKTSEEITLTGASVSVGTAIPSSTAVFNTQELSKAFIEVSKIAKPTVVSITVTSKGKESPTEDFHNFFKFFDPDFKQQPTPSIGSGSGVILTSDGYIVTNNHVVADVDNEGVEIVLDDKRKFKAKVIGTDQTTDLAVIKVEAENLPVASLGNSDSVQVGEWVLAIGNPLGLTSTVTAGIVSAIGRGNLGVINRSDGYGIENFIQTDAAINPGNSGGALVNLRGEVIGINAAIATTNARYQGYGFAIPSNLMKTVTEDLIRHGKVQRGYIGVQISNIDETMAKALGLGTVRGVLIQVVTEGGAGEDAGLQLGDVILSVDGVEVNASNELQTQIAKHHPGETVVLKIFRNKKEMEMNVKLKSRGDVSLVSNDRKSKDETSGDEELISHTKSFNELGMTVKTLSDEQKSQRDVPHGIIVTNIQPMGEASKRTIASNDIIIEAEGKKITSIKDFETIIKAHKAGDSILLRLNRSNGQMNLVAIEIPE
ncbi:MAG: Do family serine endopeptidase [Ignavibacteria bacterium]|nr:Do family serine endopeptidase [Ignavibacteria bacterium]